MATEIELKLQLSPAAARDLPNHPLLAALDCQHDTLLNTYYDTPELELTARRVALRFRKKGRDWLLTVKSAEPAQGGLAMRSEWECAAKPGQFDFSHVDSPELRVFLEERIARLQPIFTTDFKRRRWLVALNGARIEAALDIGRVESQGRRSGICEVELELLSGPVDALFELARQLQERVVLRPATPSKAERGYALFHNKPAKPARGRAPRLNPALSPIAAFRTIALSCLEQFQRNQDGLLDASQPEYVHQARVALRRLRSALRIFAPTLPAGFADQWSIAWRELANDLADIRNHDVFLATTLPPLAAAFPDHPEIRRLAGAARRAGRTARRTLGDLLTEGRDARLSIDFMQALFALPEARGDLAELAGERLKKRAKSVRQLARRVAELDAEERHALRIEIKKLRYALDFFAPLWPSHRMTRYLHALGELQGHLGDLNDLATMEADLRAHQGHSGLALGWIAGRHALLLAALPEKLSGWRKLRLPKLRRSNSS